MSDLGSDEEGHRMETSRDQQGLKKSLTEADLDRKQQ